MKKKSSKRYKKLIKTYSNNKAEILANSQVVTLNGHEAEISMVDVVP